MSHFMMDRLDANYPYKERINRLKEILQECKGRVVFLGGAGVSTGSGIPDFRSEDGLYNNMDPEYKKYKPEYLLSHNCYVYKPDLFYKFYKSKFDLRSYKPCETHKALAELENKGVLAGIITQNVDLLHEKAGSKNVIKIHGTVGTNHCVRCNKTYDMDWFFDQKDLIPRCSCGGQVRPDIVLYAEQIPIEAYEQASNALQSASCLIVAGTSLKVGSAAWLVQNFTGPYLVILNNEPTPFDQYSDVVFREDMNDVFHSLREKGTF